MIQRLTKKEGFAFQKLRNQKQSLLSEEASAEAKKRLAQGKLCKIGTETLPTPI